MPEFSLEHKALPNYERLLQQFIEQIAIERAQQHYEEALIYLWKGLSIAEYSKNHRTVLELLQHTTDLVFFLEHDAGYRYLIESLLSRTWQQKKVKTALLHFQKKEYTQCYHVAKLCDYEAEKLELDSKDPYLCNAQLQFALSMLYTGQIDELKKLIHFFDWYVENCREQSERVLIETLHLMVDCYEGDAEAERLGVLAQMLAASNLPFYPLYLLLYLQHFAHVLFKPELEATIGQVYETKCAHMTKPLHEGKRYEAYRRKTALHRDVFLMKCNYSISFRF